MVIHDWGELPASAPNRDIHIGDGSSYINQFNKKGEYIRTFGGGKTKKEGDLDCPHGGVESPCHFDQVQKWLAPDPEASMTLLDKNNQVMMHLGRELRKIPRESFTPASLSARTAPASIVVEWVEVGPASANCGGSRRAASLGGASLPPGGRVFRYQRVKPVAGMYQRNRLSSPVCNRYNAGSHLSVHFLYNPKHFFIFGTFLTKWLVKFSLTN